jgi:Endodeoxyribonuclease RusA.
MDNVMMRALIQVSEHVVKKNGRNIFINKKTGQMFPGKSTRLVKAENHMVKELRNAWWMTFHADKSPINYPVNVMMRFHFNENDFFTKKKERSKRIPDLSNLYQLVEDALQKAGVLENDYWIESHDGSKRLPTLDQNYLEIVITRV